MRSRDPRDVVRGAILRRERERLGLTQDEVAGLSERRITDRTLRAWEAGTSAPQLRKYRVLCEVLRTTIRAVEEEVDAHC